MSQDYQAWLDLRELETKLGERYITHESDDSRWQMFAHEHTLPYPSHLVPPPLALGSDDEEDGEDADVQGLTERVSILWPETQTTRHRLGRKREKEMFNLETLSCKETCGSSCLVFHGTASAVCQQFYSKSNFSPPDWVHLNSPPINYLCCDWFSLIFWNVGLFHIENCSTL